MKRTHLFFVTMAISIVLVLGSCQGVNGNASFKVTPTNLTMRVGESIQLNVIDIAKGVEGITWSTPNPKIVKIENGKVTALSIGKATVKAEKEGISQNINVTVLAKEVQLSASDVTITNPTFRGYQYQIFKSEDDFIKTVRDFLPKGMTVSVVDIKVKSVKLPDNSFLQGDSRYLTPNHGVYNGFFGNVQSLDGKGNQTYSKQLEFVLQVGNVDIPFVWKANENLDSFTLPEDGEILFTNDDFEIINLTDTGFEIVFKNLRQKIVSSFSKGESGEGSITLNVKNGEQSLAQVDKTIPAAMVPLKIVVDGLKTKTTYNVTMDIGLNLTSGEVPKITNNIAMFITTPAVINMKITPLHLSIARKTSITGVPETKATALFNHSAEMYLALQEAMKKAKFAYDEYDFANARWNAKLVESGKVVATIENAPYMTRTEFDMDLKKDYALTLKDAAIAVFNKQNAQDSLTIKLNLKGDKFFGDKFIVKHQAEYPTTIYFDKNFMKNTNGNGQKYELVLGDDFNYHFNGLNYKKYSDYEAVNKNAAADIEAASIARMWQIEDPKNRRRYVWDYRNTETKNSIMMQKVLAADPSQGTIFLGPNRTKALSGFSEFSQEGDSTIITGNAMTPTLRFGYAEAKIRVNKNGYTKNSSVSGPWYAFWWYGEMGELDMMEMLGADNNNNIQQVTHWHNGWNDVDGGPKTYCTYSVPGNYQTDWWTLGCYWSETQVIYYLNGKKLHQMDGDPNDYRKHTNRIKDGVDFWPNINSNGMGTRTTKRPIFGSNFNCAPEYPPTNEVIPFGKEYLKGIMDDPKKLHLSTEANDSGWGGAIRPNENGQLPTWLECEYVAYYLPAKN